MGVHRRHHAQGGSSSTLSLEVAYSPDYASDGGATWAVIGGLAIPVMDKLLFFDGLEASGHFGVQSFDDDATSDDYTFWDFGLSTSYDFLALDARYVDTDLDDSERGLDVCESGMMFSATIEWGG